MYMRACINQPFHKDGSNRQPRSENFAPGARSETKASICQMNLLHRNERRCRIILLPVHSCRSRALPGVGGGGGGGYYALVVILTVSQVEHD